MAVTSTMLASTTEITTFQFTSTATADTQTYDIAKTKRVTIRSKDLAADTFVVEVSMEQSPAAGDWQQIKDNSGVNPLAAPGADLDFSDDVQNYRKIRFTRWSSCDHCWNGKVE